MVDSGIRNGIVKFSKYWIESGMTCIYHLLDKERGFLETFISATMVVKPRNGRNWLVIGQHVSVHFNQCTILYYSVIFIYKYYHDISILYICSHILELTSNILDYLATSADVQSCQGYLKTKSMVVCFEG